MAHPKRPSITNSFIERELKDALEGDTRALKVLERIARNESGTSTKKAQMEASAAWLYAKDMLKQL